jgi:protein SCO1/2
MTRLDRKSWWIGVVMILAVLWGGLIVAAISVERRLNANPPREIADAGMTTPVSYWPVPAFSFVDQNGKRVTNADLAGHPWVADFIYTQCTTACPVMSAKMVILQKQAADPSLRFVSFSVDPSHDTPAKLKEYQTLYSGDPMRWLLLSTDPAGLARMTAGMKVVSEAQDDPVNPILHSNLFFLVDGGGNVRGLYDSSIDSQMERLLADLNALGGAKAGMGVTVSDGADTDIARGRQLFSSMSCLACHSRPQIAPPVGGLFNSAVHLDDGRLVWADRTYLKESILDPAAKVVRGYQKTMPSYRGVLTDGQLSDLLAYLESGADTSHPVVAATPELLVDPVCGMKVTVVPETLRVTRGGKTYYFCSPNCRDKFLAHGGLTVDRTLPAMR